MATKQTKRKRKSVLDKPTQIEKLILSFLQKKILTTNKVTNFQIADYISSVSDCSISDAEIRKIINNIRNQDVVLLLLADTQGYFIADNKKQVLDWIDVHKKKIESMQVTLQSIERQLERRSILAQYFGEKF